LSHSASAGPAILRIQRKNGFGRAIPSSFEGNYGAYIDDLKRSKCADADQPHRIKYKPVVRK